jgi:hypothetical protein
MPQLNAEDDGAEEKKPPAKGRKKPAKPKDDTSTAEVEKPKKKRKAAPRSKVRPSPTPFTQRFVSFTFRMCTQKGAAAVDDQVTAPAGPEPKDDSPTEDLLLSLAQMVPLLNRFFSLLPLLLTSQHNLRRTLKEMHRPRLPHWPAASEREKRHHRCTRTR